MTGNTAGTGRNGGGTPPDTGRLDGIELADAVESVRNQLIEAATRGTGRPLAFEVGDIQMEFTLELRKEVKGSARVKAWVVEAGADAGRTTGQTHKVAFTLKPRDVTTGEAWRIGHEGDGSTAGFGQGRPRP
ncbi:trypco2 family protein [Streptomyces sp. NPDC048669]|uniref:trypco2 family protein n=1 Tax=Streptomyces sp. NPDC048669 TaxID=3155267 RepID=UPI00341230E1